MSNYNLERGQELYFSELQKYAKEMPMFAEDLMKLGSLFSSKVGVMQEKSHNSNFEFDEETNVVSYDWVPSYRKLSSAVMQAVMESGSDKLSIKQLIEKAFELYPQRVFINDKPSKTKNPIDIENDPSYKEIISNSDDVFNLVENEIDGIAYDDIDLLEDLAEYLEEEDAFTDEGRRALGLIDQDHDSTELIGVDGELVKKIKSEYLTGEVDIDNDGNYVITCPYTGSTEVYQISTNLFASYETDQPFKIKLSLADTAE